MGYDRVNVVYSWRNDAQWEHFTDWFDPSKGVDIDSATWLAAPAPVWMPMDATRMALKRIGGLAFVQSLWGLAYSSRVNISEFYDKDGEFQTLVDNNINPWYAEALPLLLKYSLMNESEWSKQSGNGIHFRIELEYITGWKNPIIEDKEGLMGFDIYIHSDTYVPQSVFLNPLNFNITFQSEGLLQGGEKQTGKQFLDNFLKQLPNVIKIAPSLVIDPRALAGLQATWSWVHFIEALSKSVTEYINSIGNDRRYITLELSDYAFSLVKPQLVQGANDITEPSWRLGEGDFAGSLENLLKDAGWVPASFFVDESDNQRVDLAGSLANDLTLQKLGYNTKELTGVIDLGATTATDDDVLATNRNLATGFMEQLATFTFPQKTDFTSYQPGIALGGNSTANILWNWVNPISDFWGANWDWYWNDKDGMTDESYDILFGEEGFWKDSEGDRMMRRLGYGAYGQWLAAVAVNGPTNPDGFFQYAQEAWDAMFAVDSTNPLVTNIAYYVLADKEIGRRIEKWKNIREKSEQSFRDKDGELQQQIGGEWEDVPDEVEKAMGADEIEGWADFGDVEEVKSDELTDEEIENRRKFYKQCALMLNLADLKEQFNAELSLRRGASTDLQHPRSPGNLTDIPFDGRFWMTRCEKDQERLIGNLVASEEGAMFFEIPTALMTYLRPKMKLFRVENNTGKGKPLETEFVFGQFTDIDRKQNYWKEQTPFLSQEFDKGSGNGFKEFKFEFNGTNPAEARNDIKATLSLFFQSFNDFIKERVGSNGKKYRFVDLIIQPKPDEGSKTVNKVSIVHPNQYDPSFYRIRAEVGYYLPDGQVPFLSTNGKVSQKKLQALRDAITKTNRSFYLCMVDHNINVNVDGTVRIDISYRAYVETALKTYRFDALSTPEIIKQRKKATERLNQLLSEGKCTADQIKRYKATMDATDEELRKKSLQSIIQRLLDRNKIFVRDLESSCKDHFFTHGYFDSCILSSPRLAAGSGVEEESARSVLMNSDGSKGGVLVDILETDLPDLVDYDYTNKGDTLIQFFYFGDLLHTILDTLYEEENPLELVDGMGNSKFIVGSFDFNPYNSTRPVLGSTNLAQVPISVDYFSQWFTENVIVKGETRKSFPIIEFLRNLSNNLLKHSMLEACVNRKIKKTLRFTTGQISAFSPNEDNVDPFEALARAAADHQSDPIINTEGPLASDSLPLSGDSEQEDKDKIKGFYNYMTLNVLGSSLTYTGDGNYKKDIEKGRYHVNIGSNAGILKTISFEKSDIQFIREARFLQQGADGLLQLSAVYNATLEMFGNTLFYPGMEIFINPFGIGGTEFGSPTRGPKHVGGRSMSNILGIGGYHTVTHVNTSLTPERFATTIKALQYYSGDGQGNPNLDGRPDAVQSPGILGEGVEQSDEDSKYCNAATDELIPGLNEFSTAILEDAAIPVLEAPPAQVPGPAGDGPPAISQVVDPEQVDARRFAFKYSTLNQSGQRETFPTEQTITFKYDRTVIMHEASIPVLVFYLQQSPQARLYNIPITAETSKAVLELGQSLGTLVKYETKEGQSLDDLEDFATYLEDLEEGSDYTYEVTHGDSTMSIRIEDIPPEDEASQQDFIPGLLMDSSVTAHEAVTPAMHLVFGDSQAQSNNGLGGFAEKKLSNIVGSQISRISNAGKSVGYYLKGSQGWSEIEPILDNNPEAIWVFLGGNGTASQNASDAIKLIQQIKEVSPWTAIHWTGPPPPANGTMYRHKNDYETRQNKSIQIGNAVKSTGVAYYYSLYDIPMFSKKTEGAPTHEEHGQQAYGNPNAHSNDGVHVIDNSGGSLFMNDLLSELGLPFSAYEHYAGM